MSETAANHPIDHEAEWQRLGVHRATRHARQPAVSTGWATLDRVLPGGGYPLAAVTELLCAERGTGELSLLLDCIARRQAERPQALTALVAPPARLNAVALAQAGLDCARLPLVHCRDDGERVWCVEQMAHANAFAAFVVWGDTLDATALRRLQLAAERAHCPLFVYRDLKRAEQRSPAALRLAVHAGDNRQHIEILKCRGPAGARLAGLQMARDSAWTRPTQEPPVPLSGMASNEETPSHVAGPALSPLGAR